MSIYNINHKIDSSSFLPFNESPRYLKGKIDRINDMVRIIGNSKNQTTEWYNLGVRSKSLTPHSFKLSVNVRSNNKIGAYSIGLVSSPTPRIHISHFLNSGIALFNDYTKGDFFSSFSFNKNNIREQVGTKSPAFSVNQLTKLEIEYNHQNKIARTYANKIEIHWRKLELKDFFIELRLEFVGIEGEFDVTFEDLTYISYDDQYSDNVKKLSAWNPNLPPLFISYSHKDKNEVIKIVDLLKSNGVKIYGDWDFNIGDSLIKMISNSIINSGCIIVMLSNNSIKSNWVSKELELALNMEIDNQDKLKIIPVKLDDCEIPLFLNGKIYHNNKNDLENLLRTINEFGIYH